MAIILFADGSRRMAHNNDDLRERWELRKPTECERIIDEHRNGIRVPQFVPSDSYMVAEVLHFRRHLYQFRDEMKRRVKILKRSFGGNHPETMLAQEAQVDTNSNIAICNAWLKEHSKRPVKESKGLQEIFSNDIAITFTITLKRNMLKGKRHKQFARGISRWLDGDVEQLKMVAAAINDEIEFQENKS